MKILSYVHLRNIYRSTGVGRVAREMTEHLATQPGNRVEILADPGDHALIVPKVGAPWTDFRYHFLQHETSKQQARWIALNRPTAESYWPDTQIMYCTAESYVPVKKARLAVSCHDAQLFEPGAHPMSRWLLMQRFKWRLMFRRLIQSCSLFHMISEFAAERTIHFFPEIRDRVCIVPNAVSQSFFAPPSERSAKVLEDIGVAGHPYILVPGGLQYRKNADLILAAWPEIARQNPELRLVVINHPHPMYLERAKALAPSLILGGFQEEETLVRLYHDAQLVWFPTRYEGFGMPVLEAMACGTPVVSSNTTAIPEVTGNAALLLSPEKPADHIDAIAALLQDDAARARMSAAGRARASRYTWANSARLLADNFRKVL